MKKNVMMRIAAVLLVCVLVTTCGISGTFAKYTSTYTGGDTARVAKWGFNTASIEFESLFENSYTNVANGTNDTAIIAPGTSGKVSFQFALVAGITKPEVAYTFAVTTTGSSNATASNTNIRWRLTTSAEAPTDWSNTDTWDKLLADIQALDGTEGENGKDYNVADALPTMIGQTYYIHWDWKFDNSNDTDDNSLGNMSADQVVTLTVTITATQKD